VQSIRYLEIKEYYLNISIKILFVRQVYRYFTIHHGEIAARGNFRELSKAVIDKFLNI